MHLNHVLLATAIALFVNNEGVVTAGNSESLYNHDGQIAQEGQGDDDSSALDPDRAAVIAAKTPSTKSGIMLAPDSSLDDDSELVASDDDDSESSEWTSSSGSNDGLDGLFGQGSNSLDLDFDPTFLIAGKTPTTKEGVMAASDSASGDDDDDMEIWSGSSDDDSESSEWTSSSGSIDDLGGFVGQGSISLDLDFDPTLLIAGKTPTTKKGVMAASDSASGDDDDDMEIWSGLSDEDSGSFEMSGSSDQDDLFSVDGSGFDDFLKALGLSSGSLDFDVGSGSLDSKKAPKKTKYASSSASASSETIDFDDFFADMKGSGLGGGLGGLMMPPAPDASTAAGSSSASGSGKVTPECKEGWWSKTKAWFGSWIKVTTDKDCPPASAPAPHTRKLREE
uniref:RxLR-like protein n=1 Tax=Peronospora matthiolae TaxID=2874970 RepID=A0AAV1TEK8_9STRA